MISLILSIISLLNTTPHQRCSSTIFGQPGDKWAGGNALYLRRPVNSKDIGIAHRHWPMGTKVLVRNDRTRKYSVATVIDRGPYGAIGRDGKWFVKAGRNRFKWGRFRGCADLTPRLARRLNHNGRDRVSLWLLGTTKERR